MPMPTPRQFGPVNWLGLWTLYLKEVRRFWNIATQTIAAPVVTTLLFLAVFALALGSGSVAVAGLPYIQFLAPGLVMMAMTQNAFANTSSTLVIAKVQGNIVDLLMPPLSPAEQTAALALGGLTRGLVVGTAVWLSMIPFAGFHVYSPFFALYHAVMASLMLSLLGVLGGLWSEKFDHLAAVTNFIVTPLAFLSGTFYSTERLPEPWLTAAHLNPFFYMIDGFRYGMTGHADGGIAAGMAVVAAANVALALLSHRLFKTGYKLKP